MIKPDRCPATAPGRLSRPKARIWNQHDSVHQQINVYCGLRSVFFNHPQHQRSPSSSVASQDLSSMEDDAAVDTPPASPAAPQMFVFTSPIKTVSSGRARSPAKFGTLSLSSSRNRCERGVQVGLQTDAEATNPDAGLHEVRSGAMMSTETTSAHTSTVPHCTTAASEGLAAHVHVAVSCQHCTCVCFAHVQSQHTHNHTWCCASHISCHAINVDLLLLARRP